MRISDWSSDVCSSDLARDAYREAVRYEKNILLLWEQLLRLEIAGGNFPAIASIRQQALMYFPEQAEFYLFNGVASVQLEQYPQAVRSLRKGLDMANDTALKLQLYSIMDNENGRAYCWVK